jgi:23S rRNA (uracil1939-C5)-methyltransferase
MPTVTESETVLLRIDRMGAGGDGIAGKQFVAGTLAGELVAVAPGSDPQRPQLVSIIEPSPHRVAPPCRFFGACGGCSLQFMDLGLIGEWKRDVLAQTLWARSIDVPVAPTLHISAGDRRRLVLKAVKLDGNLRLGFNRRGSHEVVAIDHCLLVNARLNSLLQPLAEALDVLLPERGWAKIHVTDTPQGADLWIDAAQDTKGLGLARVSRLVAMPQIARVNWNGQLIGEKAVPRINMGGVAVDLPPRAFLQASYLGEQQMVELVRQFVGPAKSVIDLFCGVGTFSLPLARTAKIAAFDSEKPAIQALERAARHHDGLKPISATTRDLFRAPLTPEELAKVDAMVIDPPRAGCEAQARHLAQSVVPSIVALSCDPGTFARDARILIDGGYSLGHVQIVDQFVWSPHIELAAHFTRPPSGKKARRN